MWTHIYPRAKYEFVSSNTTRTTFAFEACFETSASSLAHQAGRVRRVETIETHFRILFMKSFRVVSGTEPKENHLSLSSIDVVKGDQINS
jgi:hypothetical protein